jgi:hypothetical protein
MAPHQPLPIAPRPCPGEILSSWVARFADHYDWTPEEMVALLTGGRDGLADLEPDGSVIGPLAAAARVPSGILYDLDAVRQVPALPRHWFSCGWDAASGSRRLRAGYCPWCLRDDSERGAPQHLRIGWALGVTFGDKWRSFSSAMWR